MRITAIETIQCGLFPNLLWVQVHTDNGLVGLGETCKESGAIAEYIHNTVAPYLVGKDPLLIDKHHQHLLNCQFAFNSIGVEMRAMSAIDIALWDLLGQTCNQPLVQLLGGATRDSIRVYNTCAGNQYMRGKAQQKTHNYGIGQGDSNYEDLEGFLYHADSLAQSLMKEGYQGMKIWPFDTFAEENNGLDISPKQLEKALVPFEKIRNAVGDSIEIMVELHSLWQLPAAIKIAKALEPYRPYWYEDPLRMDNLDALADYARRTNVWVAASETLGTRWAFRELLDKQAASVVLFDIGWCGGLSEGKKIASMAEAYQRPFACHDCVGPVVWTASSHLSCNAPNALWMEGVRAFFSTWYHDIVTDLPTVKQGMLSLPEGVGLATKLKPEFLKRDDITLRQTI